jgi:hypothetical protein
MRIFNKKTSILMANIKTIHPFFKLLFVVVILISGYALFIWYTFSNVSPRRFEYQASNRFLIDSLALDESHNLYYYEYGGTVMSNSIGYISICKTVCDADTSNAILESNYIMSINRVHDDTIYVAFSKFIFKPLRVSKYVIKQDRLQNWKTKRRKINSRFSTFCQN